MVREVLAGDQGSELGQHRSQCRNGNRRHGCRGVGRGGREHPTAHVRSLRPKSCPDSRQAVLKQFRGHRDHAVRTRGRRYIRRREVVSDRQSVLSLRVTRGSALDRAVTLGIALVFAQAVEIVLVFAQAVDIAVALASGVALCITVIIASESLRSMGFRRK
jgi:hypothetical protein